MKHFFIFLFFTFFCFHNTLFSNIAQIIVSPSIVNPHPINPLINGCFIEFVLDFVNGPVGLWSQEIQDRGFEEEIYFDNPSSLSYHGNRYYSDNDFITNIDKVKLIFGGYNKSDRYQLHINNTGNVEVGAYQQIGLSDTLSHHFYIYARSVEANGIAKIVFFDTSNQIRIGEKEIEIDNVDGQKISFDVPILSNHHTFNFAITYQGSGSVYFDECSLMPSNNFFGIRKEGEDIFRLGQPTIFRYPGGCFVDHHLFRGVNGVGDIDQRPSALLSTDPADPTNTYHGEYTQRMDFGLDEYITICRELNMEPLLVQNIRQGATEIGNYVDYCNSDTTTEFGKKRANNGHPLPYNIKFGEVHNEMFQGLDAQQLAQMSIEISQALKDKDNNIITIANSNYNSPYIEEFVGFVKNEVDIIGIHFGGGLNIKGSGNEDEKDTRGYYQLMQTAFDYKKSMSHFEQVVKQHCPDCSLAGGEGGSQYEPNNKLLLDANNRELSLESALGNAYMYLNFLQNPHLITFAARTMGIGLLKGHIFPDGRKTIFASPTLLALILLNNHRGNYIVRNSVTCDKYENYDFPPFGITPTPYLEVTSTISSDTLFISVLNLHLNQDILTNIQIDNANFQTQGKIYELTSNHYLDYSPPEQPDYISPQEREFFITLLNGEDNFNYTFPKHSLTILAIPGKFDTNITTFENEINIYPNPTNQSLTISFDTPKKIKNIKIYNILGKLVYFKDGDFFGNMIILNDFNLAIGSYHITIECSDTSYSRNIIINK